MPILSWFQNKLGHGNKKPSSIDESQSQREEFSEWPQALLAIGTFGLINNKTNDVVAVVDTTAETNPLHAAADESNKEESDNHAPLIQISKEKINKVLLCRGGFTIPDPTLITDYPLLPIHSESTMEKIMRKILHKKIHPQGCYQATKTPKKYLTMSSTDDDDHGEPNCDVKSIQQSKWVKNDTDYIVLEI